MPRGIQQGNAAKRSQLKAARLHGDSGYDAANVWIVRRRRQHRTRQRVEPVGNRFTASRHFQPSRSGESDAVHDSENPMIKVSVLYPNRADGRFDLDYYQMT